MAQQSIASSAEAAAARKHRIQQLKRQRELDSDAEADADLDLDAESVSSKRSRTNSDDDASAEGEPGSMPKPHPTGIKKQSRYHPGVPMTREELREWRKEARRVRNRESAAASRKRNRERVTELEGEVDVLQSKYAAALKRIVELEAAAANSSTNDSFTPKNLRQDIANLNITATASSAAGATAAATTMNTQGYRPASPSATQLTNGLLHVKTVSPPPSPVMTYSSMPTAGRCVPDLTSNHHQHITEMINRPIA